MFVRTRAQTAGTRGEFSLASRQRRRSRNAVRATSDATSQRRDRIAMDDEDISHRFLVRPLNSRARRGVAGAFWRGGTYALAPWRVTPCLRDHTGRWQLSGSDITRVFSVFLARWNSLLWQEYAVTDRTTCSGACKRIIPLGSLRYGTKTHVMDHDSIRCRCIDCITPRQVCECVRACASFCVCVMQHFRNSLR